MNNSLITQTLDSICDELVSGRNICGIQLKSIDAQAIFHWYYKNREKWAGNNKTADVEALVKYLKIKRLQKQPNSFNHQSNERKLLYLKTIRAHRFAGIHKYCEEKKAPEDFEYTFEKPLTLIEGDNGSGKTAVANAIVWCLTGFVFRSQREPEKIAEEIDITTEDDKQNEIINTCIAITPIPDGSLLRSINGSKLLLDTWVELTFTDQNGNEIGKVKRVVNRTPRGKLAIEVLGIDKLGLDPIAFEVGTKMAGLIPFIKIGEASDLGKAISALTGLRPLEDLVKHALKSQEKLRGDLKNAKGGEIERTDLLFDEIYKQLIMLLETTPSINIKVSDYSDKTQKLTNYLLRADINAFKKCETDELEKGTKILGASFKPDDPSIRKDLVQNTPLAIGLLDSSNLSRLPSIQLMISLKKVTNEEITTAKHLITQILNEGKEIEDLEKDPDIAKRQRLYARIGGWIKENNQPIDTCPVCRKELKQQTDSVTGREISEHLKENSIKDKEYLSKLIEEWAKSWQTRLSSHLPKVFADCLGTTLPEHPLDLLTQAMSDNELFASPVFNNSLSPLKQTTRDACQSFKNKTNSFVEPTNLAWSEHLKNKCQNLYDMLARANRAITFSEWRKNNDEDCKTAFNEIVGSETSEDISQEHTINTLYYKLSSLDKLVKNTLPIREALLKLNAMRAHLTSRRKCEQQLKHYARAATAIDQIVQIKNITELHVQTLLTELSSEIIKWKDKFYSPAYTGVPRIAETDIGTNGSIVIEAEIGGTKTSSKHICNSSDIRATLLAVLVSFWKHLVTNRGGLCLLIFDDLQELFDKTNREKIAASLQDIIEADAQLLMTTNDPVFGRQIVHSCQKQSIDRRRIHPIKTCRPHIVLGEFRETIREKREEFEKPENENNPQPASDYIIHLRIYIENMLQDFFDAICPTLPAKPTLSDLIGCLRSWRASGQEPFNGNAFSNLLNATILQNKSAFLNLLNKSHHANQIAFAEVDKHKGDCLNAQHLVELAHDEYYRWLRRKPISTAASKPQKPNSSLKIEFSVPLYENLAAVSINTGTFEMVDPIENFSMSDLSNYAYYVINSDTLGFSIARHSRVIVRTDELPIEDNSLVIALYKDKIYARRFLKQNDNPQVIALSAENSNPINRSPSLLLPIDEVRLLPIIGVLFDKTPDWKNRNGEAALVANYTMTLSPKIAFKVRGESAIPLALNGQIIIASEKISPADFDTSIGELVAVSFNGKDAFKRIGFSIPKQPRLRLFESIGGLGESLLLRTEEIEDDPFNELPLIDQTIYRIAGVIYNKS